jgi:hypothetical protein
MILVNIHNYEVYAIDYIDGKLNTEDLAAFELFLFNNPEIKAEIASIEIDSVSDDNKFGFNPDNYPNNISLKKESMLSEDINLQNYQTYFVAYHESDLGEKTKAKVKAFLNRYASKVSDFEAFAKLKFLPDQSIRFPLKRQLKKTTPIIFLYRGIRIAASIAILLGIAWYFSQLNNNEQQYSERSNQTEIKKELISTEKINPSNQTASKNFIRPAIENITEVPEDAPTIINDFYQPDEIKISKRQNTPMIATAFINKINIYQPENPGLKYKINNEEESIAAKESVIKIKLPKLFRSKSNGKTESESGELARMKIKINKKTKEPNRVNYVDLGPFKVYKKKHISANASELSGDEMGM